jgi:hypothetical protein
VSNNQPIYLTASHTVFQKKENNLLLYLRVKQVVEWEAERKYVSSQPKHVGNKKRESSSSQIKRVQLQHGCAYADSNGSRPWMIGPDFTKQHQFSQALQKYSLLK